MRCLLACCIVIFAVGCRPSAPATPGVGMPPPAEPGIGSPPPPRFGSSATVGAMDERFTGRITEVQFGCAVDASCNLVVDGTKHVHFGHDTRGEGPSEWGNADSLWTLQQAPDSGVGRLVEVYAATSDHQSYTLQGKAAYYVRVLGR